MRAVSGIRECMSIQTDNPELLRAQNDALARLIPLLYIILIANAWVLAAAFYGRSPNWLSIHVALALSMVCAVRLMQWWRRRKTSVIHDQIALQLRRMKRVSAFLGLAFTTWSILLFPYGDAYAQAQIGTVLTVTMLSSMLCLIHARAAAVIIALTVSVPLATFFISTGNSALLGTAINLLLVTPTVVAVILIQYRDFTRMVEARKRAELLSNENLRLANLDSLTSLPNRRAFFAHLEAAFKTARSSETRLAVGVIDLDGFKPVNDLYGHATGDRLLAEAAARLSTFFSSETLFVSRLGGDEFAYAVAYAPGNATLVAQGEEIAMLLRTPFILPEATVQISGSVGIAVYPEMAASSEELFERADYALYNGKSTKRGGAILFSDDHARQINQDAWIEQALKSADFDQELSLVFQPIVDIRSQMAMGFEALVRWNSPDIGIVSPGQFIPVAERSGIISALTRSVLRRALAAAAQWPRHMRLSFNLSVCDLCSAENALAILGVIERSEFDPKRLDLEITETAFGHDFEQVQRSVEMLRRLGCGISLDDFGTGFSSLSRLHALPLTKIKIDRSFVTELHKRPAGRKIVKSLLALARDMDLDCVTEGVETQEELAVLRELGGHLVQGYFYSRPINQDQVGAYLGDQHGSTLVNLSQES